MKRARVEVTAAPAIIQLLPEDRFSQIMADVHELIARRAYELFVERGFKHGHDVEDWLRAESQLLRVSPIAVSETAETITVKTALPGYRAEDLEIHVEPRRVFITGNPVTENPGSEVEKKKGTDSSRERLNRIFRSIDLPAQIDPEKVTATFSSGELEILLSKKAAAEVVAKTAVA